MEVVESLHKGLKSNPLAFGYPVEVIDVDYNSLVHEPVNQLSNICAKLGLECSDEYLQACAKALGISVGSVWYSDSPDAFLGPLFGTKGQS